MEEINFEASYKLQNANTYEDINYSDIDFDASNSLRNDALRKLYPREPDLIDTAAIIGLDVIPAILGGIAGGFIWARWRACWWCSWVCTRELFITRL